MKNIMLNSDINIFVVGQGNFFVPKSRFLKKINVGDWDSHLKRSDLYDSLGSKKNISNLNKFFCELTAHYWVYKNVKCNYYGFCHYRRYFSFSDNISYNLVIDNLNDVSAKLYDINNDKKIREKICQFDIILPKKKSVVGNAFKQYNIDHYINDYIKIKKIALKNHPEYSNAFKIFEKQKTLYVGNLYIMKRELFWQYNEWIFPILLEFHKNEAYGNYSLYQLRTPGFLAERLLNVFIIYIKQFYKNIKIKELPFIFFNRTDYYDLKPFYPNGNAIVFSTDGTYIKHLGVALNSLILNSNCKNNYDIFILSNDISEHQKKILTLMVSNYKNFKIRFLNCESYIKGKNLYEKNHIKSSCYLRFSIFDLFKKFKKVVYLDCDILITCDIYNIFKIDLHDKCLGAVRDTVMAETINQNTKYSKSQLQYNIDILGFDKGNLFDYFNSGVLIFDMKQLAKENFSSDFFYDIAQQKKWRWQDQDILNRVFINKTFLISQNWNVLSTYDYSPKLGYYPYFIYKDYADAIKKPYIIHYAGHQQPVYNRNTKFEYEYWRYARTSPFYELLINDFIVTLSKSSHNKRMNSPKKIIKKIFPDGSFRGRILRRFYHFIKK